MAFQVEPWDDHDGRELVPYVDDVRLLDLVSIYERAARFDVARTTQQQPARQALYSAPSRL